MTLALFDLDKTLISGDSDFLWGEFLTKRGIVDADTYQAQNTQFFKDYEEGKLDMQAYLEFCLHPLTLFEINELRALRSTYVDTIVRPMVYERAHETLAVHRSKGHHIVVISATNEFIVEGVIQLFDIDSFMGTHAEFNGTRYTGKSLKTPCFKEGKIANLNTYLREAGYSLEGSYFYSDSHNDLPLLQLVDTPIATNPDDVLRQYAREHQWEIQDW